MALIADVEITLDLPFGTIGYADLDQIIHQALIAHHLPVLDVEVIDTKPVGDALSQPAALAEPANPFAALPTAPVTRPPGAFGRGGF